MTNETNGPILLALISITLVGSVSVSKLSHQCDHDPILNETVVRMNELNSLGGDFTYDFDLCPNVPMMDLDGEIGILTWHCPDDSTQRVTYSFETLEVLSVEK